MFCDGTVGTSTPYLRYYCTCSSGLSVLIVVPTGVRVRRITDHFTFFKVIIFGIDLILSHGDGTNTPCLFHVPSKKRFVGVTTRTRMKKSDHVEKNTWHQIPQYLYL